MRIFNICYLLCVAVICSSTGQCGSIEQSDGKTVIHLKVPHLPDRKSTNIMDKADCMAMDVFIKRFPVIFKQKYRRKYLADPEKYGRYDWDNVEIRLSEPDFKPKLNYPTDLLCFALGKESDVIYLNFRLSGMYISCGLLYPLDEYITGLSVDERKQMIPQATTPVIYRTGVSGKKHYWALPYGGIISVAVVYNKKLFMENNIKFPDENWTWKDFLVTCKKLTNPAKDTWGLRLGRGIHESWFFCPFLFANGGRVMQWNSHSKRWYYVFDSKLAAGALNFYLKLSAEKWKDGTGEVHYGYAYCKPNAGDKWKNGKIGMMLTYIGRQDFAKYDMNIFGTVPVPKGLTGKRGTEINSRMYGISASVTNPVVRDAAWEYMKFLNNRETLVKDISTPKAFLEKLDNILKTTLDSGVPEAYGFGARNSYKYMTYAIRYVRKLYIRGELDSPVRRQRMLKYTLRFYCNYANKTITDWPPKKVYAMWQAYAWTAEKLIKNPAKGSFVGNTKVLKEYLREGYSKYKIMPRGAFETHRLKSVWDIYIELKRCKEITDGVSLSI